MGARSLPETYPTASWLQFEPRPYRVQHANHSATEPPTTVDEKGKGSPYSITDRRVPELRAMAINAGCDEVLPCGMMYRDFIQWWTAWRALSWLLDMKPEHWVEMRRENRWNNVELRDGRYNQVIHMVSAAKGAEDFYDTKNHVTRHEGIDLARQLDDLTAQVRLFLPAQFISRVLQSFFVPSVLLRCWLGGRKGIRPV